MLSCSFLPGNKPPSPWPCFLYVCQLSAQTGPPPRALIASERSHVMHTKISPANQCRSDPHMQLSSTVACHCDVTVSVQDLWCSHRSGCCSDSISKQLQNAKFNICDPWFRSGFACVLPVRCEQSQPQYQPQPFLESTQNQPPRFRRPWT